MSKQAFKRLRRRCKLEVNREPLPAFAWPGGYPIVYVCSDGGTLCADCVNREVDNIDDSTRRKLRDGWALAGCDVHYEGPPIICNHCNAEIESAYGDPTPTPPKESGYLYRWDAESREWEIVVGVIPADAEHVVQTRVDGAQCNIFMHNGNRFAVLTQNCGRRND